MWAQMKVTVGSNKRQGAGQAKDCDTDARDMQHVVVVDLERRVKIIEGSQNGKPRGLG